MMNRFLLLLVCVGLGGQVVRAQYTGVRQAQSPATRTAEASADLLLPELAPFYHGVASGDPLNDRVILWTRVTPADSLPDTITVGYTVATDLALQQVVRTGTFKTYPARDYTVKLDIDGLTPGTYYYYRFEALGKTSLTGRTRTLPAGAEAQDLRVGVLSCSDWREGYFTGLGHLALRNDVDFIIHTGDVIYETGITTSSGLPDRKHEPGFEIYKLEHYRARLGLYHLDPHWRWSMQTTPWVTMWDDHDIVVDALRDTSLRHKASFGPYRDRKRAAVQAAREWLPMRDPTDTLGNGYYKNWRRLQAGNLLDTYILDVRLYDRDRFVTDQEDPLWQNPDHKILGPEQMAWLSQGLKTTGSRWKLLGNQLMFSQLKLGTTPLIYENWDGYPVERNRVFDTLRTYNIDNVVIATGDFHCAFINDVAPSPTDPTQYDPQTGQGSLAVEVIAPSLSAGNFDEGDDFGLPSPQAAEGLIASVSRHNKFVNVTRHGYVLLHFTPERAQAEVWFMDDTRKPNLVRASPGALWQTLHQANHWSPASRPVPPRTDTAATPAIVGITLDTTAVVSRPLGFSVSQAAPLTILRAGPNPLAETLYLHVHARQAEQLDFRLVSATGQTVRTWPPAAGTAGINLLELPLAGTPLPTGSYTLVLTTSSGHRQSLRLVHR